MSLTRYYIVPGNHGTDLQDSDHFYYKADEVRAVLEEMQDHLEHIQEYWNGSPNERAMHDALEHILSETEKMLTRVQEISHD